MRGHRDSGGSWLLVCAGLPIFARAIKWVRGRRSPRFRDASVEALLSEVLPNRRDRVLHCDDGKPHGAHHGVAPKDVRQAGVNPHFETVFGGHTSEASFARSRFSIGSELPSIHPEPLPVACGNGAINYRLRLGSSLGLT
jgi:hypothetical protein